MNTLVVLTVVEIAVLIAGLAFFLYWIGSLLARIAANLEACGERVRVILGHGADIVPGIEHINRTGGVVASALPLLYGFAEHIVPATPSPPPPASGPRRSRQLETVGYVPPET
jgi:hypothetical protein